MTESDADAVFTVEEGHEVSAVPDGCVIYQPSRERVHYLNPTAVVVYELCATGRSVGAIIDFLQESYGLAEPPEAEVRACIDSMSKEQLILPCPSPSGP